MPERDDFAVFRRIATVSWAIIGVVVLVAISLFLIYQVRAVMSPFVYAAVIVYVLRPVVDFIESRGVPRLPAVILSYTLVAIILMVLMMSLVPTLLSQTRAFLVALPGYVDKVVALVRDYQGQMQRIAIPPSLTGMVGRAVNSLRDYALGVLAGVPEGAVGAVTTVFNLILAPIIAFYLLHDLREIRETLLEIVPRRHRKDVAELSQKVNLVVGGFLRGQTVIALIIGVSCSVYLTVVGLPYGIAIGMLAGVLNIVPYFGPIVGAIIAFVVGLFHSWQLGATAAIGMLVIQQIVALVVSPKIMSQHVKLHPALVIFSLLVGGALFGVVGMVIAIPLAGIGKAVLMHYYEPDVDLTTNASSAGADTKSA